MKSDPSHGWATARESDKVYDVEHKELLLLRSQLADLSAKLSAMTFAAEQAKTLLENSATPFDNACTVIREAIKLSAIKEITQ